MWDARPEPCFTPTPLSLTTQGSRIRDASRFPQDDDESYSTPRGDEFSTATGAATSSHPTLTRCPIPTVPGARSNPCGGELDYPTADPLSILTLSDEALSALRSSLNVVRP